VYGAQELTPPVVKAAATNFVSKTSGTGRAMVGVAAFAMVVNTVLLVLFLIKRNAPVIRAASILFSSLIMLGTYDFAEPTILTTSYF